MTASVIKRFKLSVAITLSVGLGMARVLPVQAAAIAPPTDSRQTHIQPIDSHQFTLDDVARPATAKTRARAAQTKLEPLSIEPLSNNAATPKTSQADKDDDREDRGAIFSGGFFSIIFFATILYIIYNLISSSKSVAAGSPPRSAPEPAPPAATATTALKSPNTSSADRPEQPAEEPVAVPTPALLPGLLGLSLKLFRQKKSEAQLEAQSAAL